MELVISRTLLHPASASEAEITAASGMRERRMRRDVPWITVSVRGFADVRPSAIKR
jgi:hypothetical protein